MPVNCSHQLFDTVHFDKSQISTEHGLFARWRQTHEVKCSALFFQNLFRASESVCQKAGLSRKFLTKGFHTDL